MSDTPTHDRADLEHHTSHNLVDYRATVDDNGAVVVHRADDHRALLDYHLRAAGIPAVFHDAVADLLTGDELDW
jgi:hypothetical protein